MAYIGRQQDGFGVRSRFIYTATGGQTTFNTDDSGNALSYADGAYVDVYLNGVLLDPADYTDTSLTSIVLGSGATASDILEVIVYDVFSVFSGTFTNGITASAATITGNLTGVNATLTTTDNSDNLTLTSTDADASSGPNVKLYRNSASPADGDALGFINFYGENDADEETLYGQIRASIADASDGTEDARFIIQTAVAGTQQTSRIELTGTETVINEDSKDLDFRVESDNNTHALFVQGSDGNVGINDSGPTVPLEVKGAQGYASSASNLSTTTTKAAARIRGSNDASTSLFFGSLTNDAEQYIQSANGAGSAADDLALNPFGGTVLVGKVTPDFDGGVFEAGSGGTFVSRSGTPFGVNRNSSDGQLANFYKDGSQIGTIGAVSGDIFFAGLDSNHAALRLAASSKAVLPVNNVGALSDDDTDLGQSTARFDDIYASNTSIIGTSDQNEKQQINSLTDAEMTAAKAISKLFKTFKWNESVEAKGDNARTHTGHIAQEVQQAMTDAGLNAADYAFFCSDTWWETNTEVPAVEAREAVYDDDGNLVTEAIEAIDAVKAHTRRDVYKTADEAPESATERTRLGLRYAELLAFIGAATEQRLTSIEAKVTALENA